MPADSGERSDEAEFQLRLAIARSRALWALEYYRARGELSRAAEADAFFGVEMASFLSAVQDRDAGGVVDAVAQFRSALINRAPTSEVEAAYIEFAVLNQGEAPHFSASETLRQTSDLLEIAASRYRRSGDNLVAYGDSFGLGLSALETVMAAQPSGALASQSLEDAQALLISLRELWPDIVAPSRSRDAWEAGAAQLSDAAARIGANAEAIANAE